MLELPGLELLQVIEHKGRQVDIMLPAGAALLSEKRPHLAGVLLQVNKEIKNDRSRLLFPVAQYLGYYVSIELQEIGDIHKNIIFLFSTGSN